MALTPLEKELLEALKMARGTLGYGELETLPKTIQAARAILSNAISHAEQKEREK